ncbi:MAG: hypothetical protein JWP91_14 [Fibrobacteres bacterium]|nr:hypothetical protein [Fibrobacterota bacterium]
MENELRKSAPGKSARIFEYMDFREFLRDAYRERKEAQSFFSYRYISGKLGLDSGTLSRIFKGERNLDPEVACRLARILGLDSREQQFFEALVLYGQARSLAEKNQFLERLFRLRGIKIGTLEERQYSFYKEWYYSALRELLRIHPFDGDWKKLAGSLRPAIRPAEAKHAVGVLEGLGLIVPDPERGYRLTESVITSGDSIQALFVNNLHLAMGELALRTLKEAGPEERDFSGLTLSLSRQGFDKLKYRLKQFRREILEMAQQDEGEDCVYQVNLQAFPLSFPEGRDPA